MDQYINIIAIVVMGMVVFIYTQLTDLRINVAKHTMELQNHQEWILRVQDKVESK